MAGLKPHTFLKIWNDAVDREVADVYDVPHHKHYILTNRALSQSVIRKEDQYPVASGPLAMLFYQLGVNLDVKAKVISSGSANRQSLAWRMNQDSFKQGSFSDMQDIINQLIVRWQSFGPRHNIDVVNEFSHLALDGLARIILKQRIYASDLTDPNGLAVLLDSFVTTSMEAILGTWNDVHDYDSPTHERNARALINYLKDAIKNRPQGNAGYDILRDRFVNIHDFDPEDYHTAVAKDIGMLFISTAGPVSSILSYAIQALLQHDSSRAKVYEEVDTVLQGAPCTVAHLDQLPQITAVLHETLRLHPPIPILVFQAKQDTEFGSKSIPAGSKVFIDIGSMQRDEEDGHQFKPGRMLDQEIDLNISRSSENISLIPLGIDEDMCFSHPLIMMISKLVIVSLFQKFDFKEPIKPRVGLLPGALVLQALPRP